MRGTFSAALGVLFLSAACGSPDAGLRVPVGDMCQVDTDCGRRESCHLGQCLAPGPTKLIPLDLEITPADRARLARVQLLDQALDTTAPIGVVVPLPTLFDTFQVVDGSGTSIGARLTFRGHDRIPGRELDTALLVDGDRKSGVALLSGLYDVRVLPVDDARFPGVEVRGFDVPERDKVARRDMRVPDVYRVVRGNVSQRTALSFRIEGARVSARSIGAGMPSTVGVTDSTGSYEILLPETPDTSFVLSAAPPPGLLSWGFMQTVTVVGSDPRFIEIPLEETTEGVRGLLRLRVLANGEGGPEPVADARVVLTATTGLDYRALTIEGVTDADGVMTSLEAPGGAVPVLAGRYRVTVEPPTGSAWQVTDTRLDLTTVGNGLLFDEQVVVEPKIEVRGEVRSQLGQPVAGARVRLEPTDGSPRVASATTDEDGTYVAYVERRSYVVVVTPAANSKVAEALPVGFTTLDAPSDPAAASVAASPITLAAGALLRGLVRTTAGEVLARADVEVFTRHLGRAVSLGRVTTDAEGQFAVVLPASVE